MKEKRSRQNCKKDPFQSSLVKSDKLLLDFFLAAVLLSSLASRNFSPLPNKEVVPCMYLVCMYRGGMSRPEVERGPSSPHCHALIRPKSLGKKTTSSHHRLRTPPSVCVCVCVTPETREKLFWKVEEDEEREGRRERTIMWLASR